MVLDEGWTTTSRAEHGSLQRLSGLGLRAHLACTHFLPARSGRGPRVAVTLQAIGPPVGAEPEPGSDEESLLAAHLSGRSGRAFVLPGSDDLDRVVSAGTLLARTAVDEVVTLGGGPVPAEARIDTRRFLRPGFTAGRLVLLVRPAAGGTLVPFEQPDPTPCCADHA